MATQTIERPVQRPAGDLAALFPDRYLSVTSFKRAAPASRRRCGSYLTEGNCSR
jgi:hypothetical protein